MLIYSLGSFVSRIPRLGLLPCFGSTHTWGFLGKDASEVNFFETLHVGKCLYFALTLVVCLDTEDSKCFFLNLLVFGVAEKYSAIGFLISCLNSTFFPFESF